MASQIVLHMPSKLHDLRLYSGESRRYRINHTKAGTPIEMISCQPEREAENIKRI
ncbi:hypothetical protein [Prochlorococcus sp. MIT 1307]|uniref:hypothetical protein n=1 Tax=Prochlorococcus sp. MIT 1307 TaxID=3096219 RepID=UPI002A749D1D|nr:hypothetical protein [Prochlorococcus sp. MIT 1307]